jgi:hypothetical protein
MARKSWTIEKLKIAAKESTSVRQVLRKLGLKEAGGNYSQIKKYIKEAGIDSEHFKGRAWNQGLVGLSAPKMPLKNILVKNSSFQSFKLKKRLFKEGLKKEMCEECGWRKVSIDGRIPLELHHINGDAKDNRLENLAVLCPNCHSLKLSHRGKNRKMVQW